MLEDVLASDEIACLEFSRKRCWLHIIVFLERSNLLDQELLKSVIRKVMDSVKNPYVRSLDEKTPFFSLAAYDPYEIMKMLRPYDFIGATKQIDEIRDFLNGIKDNPGQEQHILLISGPPGVGKTKITKDVAQQQGFVVTEFVTGAKEDRWTNQVEVRVIDFFEKARSVRRPTCLFIDEIDSMLPNSDEASDEVKIKNERIVTLFQTEIDKLQGHQVVLIGATNYLERIKEAIRSRAGTSVIFDLPNRAMRQSLIEDFLRLYRLSSDSSIIQRIVDATSGWSPRGLKNYIDAVIRKRRLLSTEVPIPDKIFEDCFEDVRKELEQPRKGHVRMIAPKLTLDVHARAMTFSDSLLKANNNICKFLSHSERYTRINPRYKVHTLLFGPPGGGKTEFARLVVEKTNCPCFIVEPGNSLQELSNAFSQAKLCEKAIIFIDEVDHFSSLDSSTRELIQTEMDGFNKSNNILVVLAATNFVTRIVPPILSRFSQKEEVLLPNLEQRAQFFVFSLTEMRAKSFDVFDDSLVREISSGCSVLACETESFSIRHLYEVLDKLTAVLVDYLDGCDEEYEEPLMAVLVKIIARINIGVKIEHYGRCESSAANASRFFPPSSATTLAADGVALSQNTMRR